MINLLIADDEHHIVNYIASLLQAKQDLGLEIYKAYSGIEAFEYAQKTKFSLILLDINMPGLSGLEVAKKIDELWPRTRILFLTAHDNFDYIYKAVSFNCCGYLLKIETDQTIVDKICEIVDDINKDLLRVRRINEAEQKTMLLSFLLHQNILRGICSGWGENRLKIELANMPVDHPINLDKPFYLMYDCADSISKPDFPDSQSSVNYPVLSRIDLMESLLFGKFACHALDYGHNSMLWFFQAAEYELKPANLIFLMQVAEDYVNKLYSTEHIKLVSILYSEAVMVGSLAEIAYRLSSYGERLFHGDEPYVTTVCKDSHEFTANADNDENPAKNIENLSFAVYCGDSTRFFLILAELKNQCLRHKSIHSLSAIKIYLSISLILIKYIEQNKLQELFAMHGAIYPLYSHDFKDWTEAFDFLQETSENLFRLINFKKTNRSEHIVAVIKNYIAENLCSNITLSKVSEIVNYNESYISRLFKSVTGTGVSEYVNHERLEKAKCLLVSTNLTIQTIADDVGFDTSQYFSNVFKKNVGVSPTDYRLYNTV